MKNSAITLLLVLIFTTFSYSQNFPNKEVLYLLNQTVEVKKFDKDLRYYYENFYTDFNKQSKLIDKKNKSKRPFPLNKYQSNYDSLVGKKFQVSQVYSSKEKNHYILELSNDKLGKIYYDYNTIYDSLFELKPIGNWKQPENHYCKQIEAKYDKYIKESRAITPITEGIKFIKSTKNNISSYIMKIQTIAPTRVLNKSGVMLLLSGNKTINKPHQKIEVTPEADGYLYTAQFEMTTDELNLLKSYRIITSRIYTYYRDHDEGYKLKKLLSCLQNK